VAKWATRAGARDGGSATGAKVWVTTYRERYIRYRTPQKSPCKTYLLPPLLRAHSNTFPIIGVLFAIIFESWIPLVRIFSEISRALLRSSSGSLATCCHLRVLGGDDDIASKSNFHPMIGPPFEKGSAGRKCDSESYSQTFKIGDKTDVGPSQAYLGIKPTKNKRQLVIPALRGNRIYASRPPPTLIEPSPDHFGAHARRKLPRLKPGSIADSSTSTPCSRASLTYCVATASLGVKRVFHASNVTSKPRDRISCKC
jgi:hypothetical protein